MNKNPFLSIDKRILADSGTSAAVAENLFMLCDQIGPRFAGTAGFRCAAEFMLGRFRAYKLDSAELEPFAFTAWRRGDPARLTMQEPVVRTYDCYALPYSAATGPAGVSAEILDIGTGSNDEIKASRPRVKGRLALTNGTAAHRKEIYQTCESLGAAGLILSNPVQGALLHTGSVTFGRGGEMPAVSIGCESGSQIQRLAREGSTRFDLVTHAAVERDTSWNVVGELRGSEFPEELVVMGGHLDSHEIGPGAFDNAAGAVTVMEVARLLAKQRKHLKRTIRFIGFGGEELGLLGSHHHAAKHAAEMRKARFMLNSDCPSMGTPKGLVFHRCPKAEGYVAMLAGEMGTPITYRDRFHCHSDHYPFVLQGLPTAGMAGGPFSPGTHHYVHMAADTPEKISVTDLREGAAFAARILIRAANDERWPRMRRSPAKVKALLASEGM